MIGSGPADCDLGYDSETRYSIALISSSGVESEEPDVPVNDDGSFSAEIVVPEDFRTGSALISVKGSPYDDCDYGGSGSCASYVVDLEIEP